MKNDGTTSEDIFEKLVANNHPNAFLYRIADQKELSRGNKLKGVVTRSTPSDYILTIGKDMLYAEVKSCSNATSFPFSQFTPGQNAAMFKQQRAGGWYWIWVHNVLTDNWYLLQGWEVLKTRADGKNSLKWTEMKLIPKGKLIP